MTTEGAERIRKAYIARQEAEIAGEKFLKDFANHIDLEFKALGFETIESCNQAVALAPWGKDFMGRVSYPIDSKQPNGFHIILDYRFTAGLVGNIETPVLEIHQVGMQEAHGSSINPFQRNWHYSKPIMGTAQEHGRDVVAWLLANYEKALFNREQC